MNSIDDNLYKVKVGDTLFKIARDNGLSVEQLLAMNPKLSEDTPLNIDDDINLPMDGYNYVVKPGDTMSSIARDHGMVVKALQAENPDVSKSAEISIDQILRIPAQYYVYTVEPKDTLSKISREQTGGDVSPNSLQMNNDLPDDGALSVGQKIRIPTGYYSHTMRAGETFYALQKNYNIDIAELKEANPGLDQNDIGLGQRVRIPSPSVQLAAIIHDKPVVKDAPKPSAVAQPKSATSVVKNFDDAVKGGVAKGDLTKSYNKSSGALQAYGISSEITKKAWAQTLKGITHDPVKSYGGRPLIVVDLGHGSKDHDGHYDQGTVSKDNTLTESEIVDSVGRSLAQQLDDKGYRVAFTRNPGEVFLYEGGKGSRLEKRAVYAVNLERELKAPYTVFVSLHVNSAPGDAGRGYEVKTPRAKDSQLLHNNSDKLGNLVAQGMGKHHESILRRVAPQNLQMFRELSERGVYGSDAAILVELDFLNNDSGKSRLESMKERPYNIASGISEGIDQYVQDKSPAVTMDIAMNVPN